MTINAREPAAETPAPAREGASAARAESGITTSAAFVLAMQRSAGNQAVGRHLARRGPMVCDRGPVRPRAAPTQLARVQQLNESVTQESADSAVAVERVLARWPGDGMSPPGDCAWGTYVPLRLSVESAKAVVSMLGACSPTDSCTFLATKIAAISAEIAARVALDTTCFRGGDTGHRQQVQDKINMLNRCYRFFGDSGCAPELITAMEGVVAKARELIELAAIAVAAAVIVAAVVALVAAIIALAEVIAAAAAAAAESALVLEAVAALTALLAALQRQLASV